MGAPRLRNRPAERPESFAGALGPIGEVLLWPIVELAILLGLLLAPIWFLVMLLIGPGKPSHLGRSDLDIQRNKRARK